MSQLRARTGLDLSGYNPRQMERRLQPLLARSRVDSYGDYLSLLQAAPARLRDLRDAVTINVSEFFRSPERWADLRSHLLPDLLAEGEALRVWSAGCSTGAEACSLSMLLDEAAPNGQHVVLGTDIDRQALTQAQRGGGYHAQDVRYVPDDLRAAYLVPEVDGTFSVTERIRARVSIRQHDLLADAVESGFDLIACRNVMMYFTPPAQQRLVALLYDALRPGGILFTGSPEGLLPWESAGLIKVLPGFYKR